jgi:hypothetical protein
MCERKTEREREREREGGRERERERERDSIFHGPLPTSIKRLEHKSRLFKANFDTSLIKISTEIFDFRCL